MNQCEPTLEELLSEPIIQQIMRSDGVEVNDIRYLMHKVTVSAAAETVLLPPPCPQFSMPCHAA